MPLYIGSVTLVFTLWRLPDKRLPGISPVSVLESKDYPIVLNGIVLSKGTKEGSYDLKVTRLSVKLTRGRMVMG